MSVDDLGLPDIPLPEVVQDEAIEDQFKSAVAYSFMGLGHAGGKLAQAFWNIGYRRVCAVNTAAPDLAELKLPEDRRLCLDTGGAAKNRLEGKAAADTNREKILAFLRKSYGTSFDRLMICASLGGGTGSGGFSTAVEIATEYMTSIRRQEIGAQTKVGLIVVIPSNSERDLMHNAWEALHEIENLLKTKAVSPVVLIDNEQAMRLYGGSGLGVAKEKINQSVAGLFHLFNIAAVLTEGVYNPFDKADYTSILDNGVLTYGLAGIADPSLDSISRALTGNLTTNALSAGVVVQDAKFGVGLILGPKDTLDNVPANTVEGSFEALKRVMPRAIIHRGVYAMARPLSAYTAAAGVGLPKQRLTEISRIAGLQDWDG